MSNIEQRVMANVGVIYAIRGLFSATALKLYALVVSVGGIASLVSVPHVLVNLRNVGLHGLAPFVETAVLKTHTVVQLALVVGMVAFALLLADLVRAAAAPRTRLA